ncbi:MAG: hypothetical protein HQL97_10055 [Magnetococcales bacterium]|nr:hypothetical protein [Magnetococcales bacterium]
MSGSWIDDQGEVRALTLDDFLAMRPIRALHPEMPERVGVGSTVEESVTVDEVQIEVRG